MSFEGVKVNKLEGGLNRQGNNTDSVFALAYTMNVEVLEDVSVGESYRLINLKNLEQLGIDEAYDANNKSLIHHEIKEFFELSPEAILFLLPIAPDVVLADAKDVIVMSLKENPTIKCLGLGGQIAGGVGDSAATAATAQEIVNDLAKEHHYLDGILVAPNGNSEENYPDAREFNCPDVTFIAAQDRGVSQSDVLFTYYAAIGCILGMGAVRQVNENWGSVNILNKPRTRRGTRSYPLTNTGNWAEVGLSIGKKMSELSYAEQKDLTSKGWMYAGSFNGFAGTYLNSSPTSISKASDYAYIENNRVWKKAARNIREALVPEVRGIVKKNPKTGYILPTTIARWGNLLNKSLEVLVIANEISGFDYYINPKQTLGEDDPLQIRVRLVVDGIVHEFEIDLGLTQNI